MFFNERENVNLIRYSIQAEREDGFTLTPSTNQIKFIHQNTNFCFRQSWKRPDLKHWAFSTPTLSNRDSRYCMCLFFHWTNSWRHKSFALRLNCLNVMEKTKFKEFFDVVISIFFLFVCRMSCETCLSWWRKYRLGLCSVFTRSCLKLSRYLPQVWRWNLFPKPVMAHYVPYINIYYSRSFLESRVSISSNDKQTKAMLVKLR